MSQTATASGLPVGEVGNNKFQVPNILIYQYRIGNKAAQTRTRIRQSDGEERKRSDITRRANLPRHA